jgi:hypothetical protein
MTSRIGQPSTSPDPLDMQDMPRRVAVNQLMPECADKLQVVSAGMDSADRV